MKWLCLLMCFEGCFYFLFEEMFSFDLKVKTVFVFLGVFCVWILRIVHIPPKLSSDCQCPSKAKVCINVLTKLKKLSMFH